MKTLSIKTANEYLIHIDQNVLSELAIYCLSFKKRIAIVTDTNIEKLYGSLLKELFLAKGLSVELFSFPAGEQYKTRETKQLLEDQLFENHFGRDTLIIAIGGGVVTDMAGFLAATYCRGVPVIYAPTTLLAMVDASIGGKTAVNTPYGKNLIGTFTQPESVWIDTSFLKTLPEKEWSNGLVEMLKHGLIADENIFTQLKNNLQKINARDPDFLNEMIYASCLIKKNIVEQDEKDQHIRQLLNFGHTIGHAIETLENYAISHGEAVAMGILVESLIAVQLGFQDKNIFQDIYSTFKNYQISLNTRVLNDKDAIFKLLTLDKKSIAKEPQFVLLNAVGKAKRENGRFTFPVKREIIFKAMELLCS